MGLVSTIEPRLTLSTIIRRENTDHPDLHYRPEFVLPMCRPHNSHHNNHGFVIFGLG